MDPAVAAPPRSARRRERTPLGAEDDDLLARWRQGDERAFEVVYDRYHLPLLAFCRHMLGSREEAEDALQHVFLAAHRTLLADKRSIALKPWLYAVARNRCLSMLRARRPSVQLDAIAEPSVEGLAVGTLVEQREDLRGLLGDLAMLADEQRVALLLAELGDLSHAEIGEALGVRREKVKALVFQARETLMSLRDAREADCREIQLDLATLHGGALRRSKLQRHLQVCRDCAEFRTKVRQQRQELALVLPVVPGVLLRKTVISSTLAVTHTERKTHKPVRPGGPVRAGPSAGAVAAERDALGHHRHPDASLLLE